jgi:hypothetical protein
MVMEVRFGQFSKAPSLMVVTLYGIMTEDREVQSLKAYLLISVTYGIVTDFKAEQP